MTDDAPYPPRYCDLCGYETHRSIGTQCKNCSWGRIVCDPEFADALMPQLPEL